MTVEETINSVEKSSDFFKLKAEEKWSHVAMPLGSLGILGDDVTKICAAERTITPEKRKKCVVVFCADNGVVEEGISQSQHDITTLVVKNMCTKDTSVCKMAQVAGADVFPVDMGMIDDVDDETIINMKVARGTANFAKKHAMTDEEVLKAIKNGIELSKMLSEKGYNLFALGEMGIGNTTTSSAVASVILQKEPREMTGKGAGLSDAGVLKKIEVIKKAIEKHKPDSKNPIDVIKKVGGFDIAAMAGFIIGAAALKKMCVIDGFISSVGALCAIKMCPDTKDYILASHISGEKAGELILNEMGLKAPINAKLRLGEGTGAVMFMPLIDMALTMFNEMVTFEDINMEAYKPL